MEKPTLRRGRPPAHQAQSRNEALFDAATEVFLEAGFAGAKMTLIAKKAGASMETLYARYPTKAELFAALIERRASGLLHVIGPMSPDREPREALTTFGIELVAMMTRPDTQKLHRLVIAGSIEMPELGMMFWETGVGRGFDIIRTYLDEQKRCGKLAIIDVNRSADMLMGMFVGKLVLRATLGIGTGLQSPEEQHTWVAYVVDTFLQALAVLSIP